MNQGESGLEILPFQFKHTLWLLYRNDRKYRLPSMVLKTASVSLVFVPEIGDQWCCARPTCFETREIVLIHIRMVHNASVQGGDDSAELYLFAFVSPLTDQTVVGFQPLVPGCKRVCPPDGQTQSWSALFRSSM